jgi:hypothetical protein
MACVPVARRSAAAVPLQIVKVVGQNQYFAKFLTSHKLISLQLMDGCALEYLEPAKSTFIHAKPI